VICRSGPSATTASEPTMPATNTRSQTSNQRAAARFRERPDRSALIASHPVDAAVDHAHAVADAQLAFSHVLGRDRAAAVEAHGDAVAIAGVRALDLVADDTPCDGAADGRCSVADPGSELVADDAARDAADHGAEPERRTAAFAIEIDVLDDAVFDPLRDRRHGDGRGRFVSSDRAPVVVVRR